MLAKRTQTINFLTLDESHRLFRAIRGKRDRAILLLAYWHGVRANEVELLQAGDLDLKKLHVMVHQLNGSISGRPSATVRRVEIHQVAPQRPHERLPYAAADMPF